LSCDVPHTSGVPCCPAALCGLQLFMAKLAEVVKPRPASLSNYRRMCEPREVPPLQVKPDKQLSRTAFFRQAQVSCQTANFQPDCPADAAYCTLSVEPHC
jgi:hypothetical protein